MEKQNIESRLKSLVRQADSQLEKLRSRENIEVTWKRANRVGILKINYDMMKKAMNKGGDSLVNINGSSEYQGGDSYDYYYNRGVRGHEITPAVRDSEIYERLRLLHAWGEGELPYVISRFWTKMRDLPGLLSRFFGRYISAGKKVDLYACTAKELLETRQLNEAEYTFLTTHSLRETIQDILFGQNLKNIREEKGRCLEAIHHEDVKKCKEGHVSELNTRVLYHHWK